MAFCRNGVIYMREDVARPVVEGLAHALAPGGLLFLGDLLRMVDSSAVLDAVVRAVNDVIPALTCEAVAGVEKREDAGAEML